MDRQKRRERGRCVYYCPCGPMTLSTILFF
jgi:hypothetical protein